MFTVQIDTNKTAVITGDGRGRQGPGIMKDIHAVLTKEHDDFHRLHKKRLTTYDEIVGLLVGGAGVYKQPVPEIR